MPNIVLAESDLHRRVPRISKMLSPLQGRHVPCQPYRFPQNESRIFAAHGGTTDPRTDYRTWRFRSSVRAMECQYFELWRPTTSEAMYLDRAYLHFYLVDTRTRESKEIVLVHSDPNCTDENKRRELNRRGLHLHVSIAEQPLPKCHFPLVLSHFQDHLDMMLASIDSFTSAFSHAVEAIGGELMYELRNA